jgi:AraC family transcriptional regulator
MSVQDGGESLQWYASRINRTMDYIEGHLDGDLTLDAMARIACFSPFHFHRIFSAYTGETPRQFVSRHRLEKGSRLLRTRPRATIMDIALDCGFANSSSFSKAFSQAFGMSPGSWRDCADSKPGHTGSKKRTAAFSSEGYIEYHHDRQVWHGEDIQRSIEIRQYPSLTLAYVRHQGGYEGDSALFQTLWNRLLSWAAPRGLGEGQGVRYFALYHNDPGITDEEKLRVSIGLTVPEGTAGNEDVAIGELSPARFACIPFRLGARDYADAWRWVYQVWLPRSGFAPDEGPAFEEFLPCGELFPGEEKEAGKQCLEIGSPIRPLD